MKPSKSFSLATKATWTEPTLCKFSKNGLGDVEGLVGSNSETVFTSLTTS